MRDLSLALVTMQSPGSNHTAASPPLSPLLCYMYDCTCCLMRQWVGYGSVIAQRDPKHTIVAVSRSHMLSKVSLIDTYLNRFSIIQYNTTCIYNAP